MRSKDVKRELDTNNDVRKKFGGSKKIIVPKTMVVGNKDDSFSSLMLFSSLDHERYDARQVATLLNYSCDSGITHIGIDTSLLMGRKSGECSVVVSIPSLEKFKTIQFSDGLKNALRRSNALAAYPLGDKIFFCMEGKTFIDQYAKLLHRQGINSNLRI